MTWKDKIMDKWTKQSLKKKWALTSAFVIFISYLLICTVLYISLHSWLYSDEEQAVQRSMSDLTTFFEGQGHRLSLDDLERNDNLINAIVDKKETARILNKDGVEILRINNTATSIPPVPENVPDSGYTVEHVKVDGQASYVAIAKLNLGQFSGYIQLTHPLTTLVSLMRYLLTAMILMGIGALIASAAIGYTLATRLLKPLDTLTSEMNRVADKGFDVQIQLNDVRHDEIGELISVYKRMMGQLEESFLQQQRFISDASHELRTPIQVLEGHLKLLQRWGKDDAAIMEESLSTSLAEVARMRSLIEELLDLARRETVDQTKYVDLVEATRAIARETEQLHPQAKIIIEYDKNNPFFAAISEDAYNQIVRNLLQNAIRYTEKIPNVRICLTNEAQYHRIEVEDNGIGIQKDAIPQIFNRFFRADEARSREHGGTGLGLAIVKMLVEKYNGKISVDSDYGKGTKFTILLPVKSQLK
ncbi:HAMP domain-containing sensor histidine kinase [Kurthia sibirica]|uniref:Signal transduction histidine-protein kinase ArlS n=1 Tax=Kurthia sibirica TaxID=202750 RepID=A0A2U3AP85_9BACL|nr:HAMP domain-containing histidine kinase [Kurthia sibirica]PWI26363.1 two-component sensor histidine kinase [Kurthia sibirica]GEK34865.1 two-component sensor histidine kinase [Kurthia sibirica]